MFVEDCNARAAMDSWRTDNSEAPNSTLLGVRLRETNRTDAQTAAEEIADMKRRHGLT